MKSETKIGSNKLTIGLMIVYLIVMTWIIVFKMELSLSALGSMHLRSINLIPFAESVIVNGSVDISEIIMNMVVFIPFGVYLSMIKPNWNLGQKTLPIFLVALSYEVVQYIFAIGTSDITDLIGNTLGGVIGICVYALFSKFLGNKTNKVLNVLAFIGTALVVVLLGIITLVNM